MQPAADLEAEMEEKIEEQHTEDQVSYLKRCELILVRIVSRFFRLKKSLTLWMKRSKMRI